MPADEVRARFSQISLLKPVLECAEIWFEGSPEVVFHDPVPAVCLFDDKVCCFERGEVTVELEESKNLGFTYWRPAVSGRHEVATTVDIDRFFDCYFGVF